MCGRCMYLHPTVVNEGGSSSQQPSEASSLCRHRGWGKSLLRKQKAREEKSDKKGERAWNLLQACEMWCSLECAGVRSSPGSRTSYRRPDPTLESTSARALGLNQSTRDGGTSCCRRAPLTFTLPPTECSRHGLIASKILLVIILLHLRRHCITPQRNALCRLSNLARR
jgi:hypothetical protein